MKTIKQFLAEQYTGIDRFLLLGLVVPASVVAFGLKWDAVHGITPFSLLPLLDFLRMNVAYFALIVLWCALLLRKSASHGAIRIVAVVYFLWLLGESLLSTAAIFVTGANIPLAPALYSTYTVGGGLVPLPTAELFFLFVLPTFVVWLALAKWHLLTKAEGGKYRLPERRVFATTLGLLLFSLLPPLHPDLELNAARPSYLYNVIENLKRTPFLDGAMAATDHGTPVPVRLVGKNGGARPNLVFVVLESVGARATSLGNLGFDGVTPNLHRLSSSSRVYDRAYTVVPHTSKALVALLCGTEPFYRHPIFESHLGIPGRCLASLLGEHAYETVFFQSSTAKFENRRGLVKQMGFRDFFGGEDMPSSGFELANYFGYEDAVMLDPSREWLAQRKAPFLAVYLTGTTHHPYWAPSRLGFRKFPGGQDDEDRNKYLNAVHYLDWFVDQLIQQYKATGVYDDTIFVIVGDHGESFSENSRRQHNASLYEETLAVPLLIHAPRWLPSGRDSRIVSLTDILPSVVEVMGFELAGEVAGSSFVGNAEPRRPAIASCWYDDWCMASVDSRYKYIYNFDEKKEELYDLHADPDETTNLADRYPDLTTRRREQVLQNRRENLARYDRFYRGVRADYWSARGDSAVAPAALLSLPADDPRRLRFQEGRASRHGLPER